MTDARQQAIYFVRSMGKITGPFDIERLKRLRARGQFGPASDVSTDKRHWEPWSSLEELSPQPGKSRHIDLSPRAVDAEPQTSSVEKAAPPVAPEWYYAGDTGAMGPVSRGELLKLLSGGALTKSSLVWQEGMQDWQPLEDVPDLAKSMAGKAAVNTSQSTQRLRYSNFWRRVAAQFFDHIILQVICLGLLASVVTFLLPGDVSLQNIYIVGVIAQILVNWLYYAALESSQLQGTFGKLAMELKVTNLAGKRIGFGQASGRYFGKILSTLILGIGFLMIAFTEKRQGLHDIMADCLVLDQQS